MKRFLVGIALLALGHGAALAQTEPDVHAVNARAHAEALKLAFHGLEDLVRRRSTAAVLVAGGTPPELHGWAGDVPPAALGGVNSGWLRDWTRRGLRARFCTDDPAVPGTLLVWLHPARPMGVGTDHRSVRAAPRLYGRERRTLHWLDGGVAEGGDGRNPVTLPACMTAGLPNARAALAGAVEDPWVASGPRAEWERRDAVCPVGTHRPPALPASEPARVERRRVTRQFNRRGVEVGTPSFGAWQVSIDLCERDYTVTETATRSCTYTVEGQSAVGYRIVTRRKTVSASGESFSPWTELFSTCWTGTVAAIPPPQGTPESLPAPTITFPTWVEREDQTCPTCFDGTAFRWRRHTDRHVKFEWDSAPTIQTDVQITNWIVDRSACTPTPPTVVNRGTRDVAVPCSCAPGWTGTCSRSRTETFRTEIPCGGSLRTVVEDPGNVIVTANNCRRTGGDPSDPVDDEDPNDGGDDGGDDGGNDGGDGLGGNDGSGDEGPGNMGYGDVGVGTGVEGNEAADAANAANHSGMNTDSGDDSGGSDSC